jgi:hypothetical protein
LWWFDLTRCAKLLMAQPPFEVKLEAGSGGVTWKNIKNE